MKQMKEISFKDRDAIFGRLEELASRGNMSKDTVVIGTTN
jgi:hypothetical protein